MRWLSIAVALVAFVPNSHAGDKVEKIDGEIYKQPYFVKNTAPLKGNPAYAVVTSKKPFDEIFGVGFVMGQKYKLIDDKTFESKIILVVVNKGPATFSYKDVRTERCKGKITLFYTVEKMASSSTSAAPLIVAVDASGSNRILFSEGGKESAQIELKDIK